VATLYITKRDPKLRLMFAIGMAVAIAAFGWVMMTIGSSPTVKGASFIWLPAALQLVAGIWLGPWYGFLAAGLGAYAAGILAYGGWGIVDIIMNLIAGGFANAMLPALLFTAFKIDTSLGAEKPSDVLTGAIRVVILTILVLAAGLLSITLNLTILLGNIVAQMSDALVTLVGFLIPLIVLVVGAYLLLKGLNLKWRHFLPAIIIAVLACAVSAFIGVIGATVGGIPFMTALVDPGIGWFTGDTVSAILGLFLLPLYTQRVKDAGIAQ